MPAARPGRAMSYDDRYVASLIAAMRSDVLSSPEIYRPGSFWDELIAAHLEMLRTDGIANLKRTVSNNYYNWLVTSLRDPQLRRAILNCAGQPALAPLLNRLEASATGLRIAGRPQPFTLSRAEAWRYKFFVDVIWEMARRNDAAGLTDRLAEPEVGNPIRVRRRDQLISQDLANSIMEFTFAARSGVVRDGSRIAELGAGYGRLAYVFAEARPLTYCIFDVWPALAVAQWYFDRSPRDK